MRTTIRILRRALVSTAALTAASTLAGNAPVANPSGSAESGRSLEEQFGNPPNSARPRVWWHWMNGNITKDGIAKDLAWMKRVGIGGMQNFDANLMTPQIVEKRLAYMTPEWKEAFKFAAQDADRLGLELAIAASPGWSETGGPWVKPEDGLKKVVWSEIEVAPGKHFAGKLPAPPIVTGPYQELGPTVSPGEMISGAKAPPRPQAYGQIALIAVPVDARVAAAPSVSLGGRSALKGDALLDDDLGTSMPVPRGTPDSPAIIRFDYAQPQTMRSLSMFIPGAKSMFGGAVVNATLEMRRDGGGWAPVADIPVDQVPSTIAFDPVTSSQFRVRLMPAGPGVPNLGSSAPGVAMDFGAMGEAFARQPLQLAELRLSPDTEIDRFQTKAGFATTLDYFALGGPDDGAAGAPAAQVVNLTRLMKPDGSLDWKAPALPKGKQWRVIRFGWSLLGTMNHPATPEATGLEVDKFDGAAVRAYMEHYLGMYRDAVGPALIGDHGVRAILTDSIEVGAANWTPRMIEQFTRLRGYDPMPWLPTLAGVLVGSRADSDRFLYDYRRTLADLMASEHYGTVATVAHENDLKVYGEALEDQRPSLGDDMTMRSHTDIPMSAMWMHSRAEGPRPGHVADIKGAASVAHIYGQNLVAAESMTAAMSPWDFTPKDLRRVIDLEFVTGVNRPVIHTSLHVPVDDKKPGLSLFIFGQYFNRNETWAELARPWIDYISRSSLLLQEGRNVADVAYFYGEEGPLTALYGEKPVADAPTAHAYDFVSFDALMHQLSNDGDDIVARGGARYKAIYLGGSSDRMTLATLEKLAALVEGGATVIGKAPVSTPSLSASEDGEGAEWTALVKKLWPGGGDVRVGKGRVIVSSDVEAALGTMGIAPDFAFTGAGPKARIPFVHRRDDGGDIYYLVNRQNEPVTFEAHFRVTGKAPELWHADTGKSEAVGYRIENGETVVPMSLLPEESVFVVLRRPAVAKSLAIRKVAPTAVQTIGGPWNVAFQQGRGAPATATFDSLSPLNESAVPGIKYFSGIATYSRSFTAPKGWQTGSPLWLDLGEVNDLAQVYVNGRDVGTVWHAPYRLDISSAAKSGQNTIEVRVANKWVNRLIGDAQPGADKVTWTALPTYRPDAPLRPSGLVGPVELMTAGR